ALYQGDIILGSAERLSGITEGSALMELDSAILFGLGRRDARARWPGGVVRYRIHPDLPATHRVHSAIAAWEAATHIRFEQITQPGGNYIEFVRASGCSSFVGMVGGR